MIDPIWIPVGLAAIWYGGQEISNHRELQRIYRERQRRLDRELDFLDCYIDSHPMRRFDNRPHR